MHLPVTFDVTRPHETVMLGQQGDTSAQHAFSEVEPYGIDQDLKT